MAPSWVERLTAHTRRLFPNADRRLFYAASNDNRNDPEWIYRIAGAMSSDDTAHALAFHLAFPRSTSVSLEAMTSLVHTVTGLRHIRLAFRTISDIHVDLVRRNSLTLESIHLSEIDSRHCLRLLIQQDAQGSNKPMVYPNVRTLEVGTDCLYYLNQRTLPLGVPFPSLVSLNCMHAYPFANDVLLRGNSTTLESISLCVDERTLGMFAKTDLFSDSNDNAYPVLRRVRIYSTDYSRYVLPADRMPDVLRMTLCVPEGVQCLELDALRGAAPDSVISAIHNAPISRRNLRVLGIPHIKFSLAGLVELVQMLPNIEHLAIALSVEEGLHSELHPASNDCRLSTLRLYFSANETDRQLFEQATRRLALLIPSLRRIITDRGDGGIAILKPADLALNPADPVDMIQ
ncbi:hypothetical protein GQ54DRAFT_311433 [Martensiomyces pterosporus]|nr:hypothetical protein GQ54DRAFT_311433 [Martensiomyces pterosporus]